MAPKLFLTGTTGYIGGTVLDTIVTKHPEYEITVLLRNVPSDFASRYPKVSIVRGDYDNIDIIADTASNAKIVVHSGDSDHEPSIKAIVTGLLRRNSTSFLIHLSGTMLVADWQRPDHLGRLNPKVWSDIDNIDEITSMPLDARHRNTDKIIQDAGVRHSDKLKTAICCPPDIYGPGRGPGRTNSIYFPVYLQEIEKTGSPFYAGEGTNTRSWVHIEDLMIVYLKLVEAAAAGGGNATWGKEGYYFAASQEVTQVDTAKATGRVLHKHGIVQTAEPKQLPLEQVDGMMNNRGIPHIGTYMFASNSRTRADRAKKLFGYQPNGPSLWEALEADVLACQKTT